MICSTGPYKSSPFSLDIPSSAESQPAAAASEVACSQTSSQEPPPPSLESRMMEHKVAQAFPKKLETSVSKDDFDNFIRFVVAQLQKSTTKESTSANFLKSLPLMHVFSGCQTLFKSYQNLVPVYRKLRPMTKQELEYRQDFQSSLWFMTYLFSQICNRDMITVADKNIPNYKRHYQENLHPNFLILQRLINFLHVMLEKEGAEELLNPLSTLKIDLAKWVRPGFVGGLGFYPDTHGYIPIAYSFHAKEIESTYLYYGEDALPSKENPEQTKVFLNYLGEFITQSGLIIDIESSQIEIREFLGTDKKTPFHVGEVIVIKLQEEEKLALPEGVSNTQLDSIPSSKGELTSVPSSSTESVPISSPTESVPSSSSKEKVPDSTVDQMQSVAARLILSLVSGEIKRSRYDLYFVPIPESQIEKREFAYCLLQDLVARSQNAAQPKAQKLALEWLQKIEAMEEKPVQSLMQELEKEIRADLRTEYEIKVQKEQELRSQRVRDGLTEGLKKEKKSKKDRGKNPPKQTNTPPSNRVEQRVEEAFQKFKVHGCIKYRNMLKVARQAMKEYPKVFEATRPNQRGSHHVLHTETGPATLAQSHGKKDSTITMSNANQFLDDLMKHVKSALQLGKKKS